MVVTEPLIRLTKGHFFSFWDILLSSLTDSTLFWKGWSHPLAAKWSHDTGLPIRAEVRAFTAAVGKRWSLSAGLAPWQNENPGLLGPSLGDIRGSLNKNRFYGGKGQNPVDIF